jgi:hypothetical protein
MFKCSKCFQRLTSFADLAAEGQVEHASHPSTDLAAGLVPNTDLRSLTFVCSSPTVLVALSACGADVAI